MNRDDVLRIAKQAGMAGMASTVVCEIPQLHRFAYLVIEAERKKQRDELLAELQKCAEVFRRYEQIHLLKCSDEGNDKAHENACLAARAEAVISNVKGGA